MRVQRGAWKPGGRKSPPPTHNTFVRLCALRMRHVDHRTLLLLSFVCFGSFAKVRVSERAFVCSFPKLRLSERAFVCSFANLRGSERRLFVYLRVTH